MTESAGMPKTIKTVRGTRVMCPEDCRYRDRLAPFCGYCMMEILGRKKKTEEQNDGSNKEKTAGQAGEERL